MKQSVQRRRKNKGKKRLRLFPLAALALFVCTAILLIRIPQGTPSLVPGPMSSLSGGTAGAVAQLEAYGAQHGYTLADYPKELVELYEKNPDTRDFVFEYPANKDKEFPIDLSASLEGGAVPLFMQWDQRWGYEEYAGELFALSGCGPTCLSMVAVYLTGDTGMTPKAMGEFAQQKGYATDQNGTAWTLFSQGAAELGLRSQELPLDKGQIVQNLQAGNPIVCIMGPGDFTTTGHYIVMTGYVDGKISVNDPNSYENSEALWSYEQICGQIRNLWAFC